MILLSSAGFSLAVLRFSGSTARLPDQQCGSAGQHCTRAVRLRGLLCPSGLVGRAFLHSWPKSRVFLTTASIAGAR